MPFVFGPFLPVSEQDVDVFNDAFSDELDSAFTSSIGCCDFCYADFRERWPDVSFRRDGGEMQSMDTLWAVDEARLAGAWWPVEYSTLRHLVRCPRCQPVVDNDFVALAVDVSEFWAVWKKGSHPRFRPVGPLEALDH